MEQRPDDSDERSEIAALAETLNRPLTAILLCINEIHGHRHVFSGERRNIQRMIENAKQVAEQACELARKFSASRPLVRVVSHECLALPPVFNHSEALTRREREALSLIVEGFSNKESATRMKISLRTFESHRAHVMRKYDVHNTADLFRKAMFPNP
jgi:DNA-binding CsgD family transcriptional regulator